jgi:hypothetical protein
MATRCVAKAAARSSFPLEEEVSVMSSLRSWWHQRFGDLTPSLKRGYGVWGSVAVVVAIPEIWAFVGRPRWPTISGTVGHLEERWPIVAVAVVSVIVIIAVHAIRLPLRGRELVRQASGSAIGLTPSGRVTIRPDVTREVSAWLYFPVALACIVGGSYLAASLSDNRWILGYSIYGLIAVFGIIIPSILAYGPTPDAPFAGLFPTVADLQVRLHIVGLILLTGLVVLLIHLALYPWPDVSHGNPTPDSP